MKMRTFGSIASLICFISVVQGAYIGIGPVMNALDEAANIIQPTLRNNTKALQSALNRVEYSNATINVALENKEIIGMVENFGNIVGVLDKAITYLVNTLKTRIGKPATNDSTIYFSDNFIRALSKLVSDIDTNLDGILKQIHSIERDLVKNLRKDVIDSVEIETMPKVEAVGEVEGIARVSRTLIDVSFDAQLISTLVQAYQQTTNDTAANFLLDVLNGGAKLINSIALGASQRLNNVIDGWVFVPVNETSVKLNLVQLYASLNKFLNDFAYAAQFFDEAISAYKELVNL